jgi:hypothetical protein
MVEYIYLNAIIHVFRKIYKEKISFPAFMIKKLSDKLLAFSYFTYNEKLTYPVFVWM